MLIIPGMKKSRLFLVAFFGGAFSLGISACEQSEEVTKPLPDTEEPAEVAVKTPEAEPAPAAPKADLDAVAKAAGFARFAPDTTHAYVGVYDGKGFIDEVRELELVKILEKQASEQAGVGIDDLEENPQAQQMLSLLSEEIFLALGDGAPDQLATLVAFNESTTRHWIASMMKLAEAQLTGNAGDLSSPNGMVGTMFASFLSDKEGGLEALAKAEVPPVTLGFKVSDEEVRGQILEMAAGGLAQLLGQIGPDGEDVAEAVQFERAGSTFTGIKLVGEKLAGKIGEEEREQMSMMLDDASIDRLIEILKTKNIVIAVGTHDHYLVGFAGSDAEDLQIADSPATSVLARTEMNFLRSYADKSLLMVTSTSKELQEKVSENVTLFGSLALGMKDGLGETEAFGDTRDLEVLLELVAKQERALFDMYAYDPSGMVVFREEGLKVEAYGGSNFPDLDLDAPRKYAGLGMADDVFLFSNWVENPAFTEQAFEYLDSLGEAIYLGAKHVTKLEMPDEVDPDFQQFAQGFGIFDEKIRPHLLDVWTGLRQDLNAALGAEGALIVDLQGGLPTVPGLPDVVVEQGKAPRIGVIAPAENPEKLGDSWKNIQGGIQGLLKFASEMSGENIPMQRPLSSEKDDLKTWFFSFPFLTDDFVPSISVDEENFYMSTSKSFVQTLSQKLEDLEVDPSQKGMVLNVNFSLLQAYLQEWVQVMEDNAAAVFGEGTPAAQDFQEALPVIKEVVAALSEIKSLTGHIRNAEGTVRSSFHFAVGE